MVVKIFVGKNWQALAGVGECIIVQQEQISAAECSWTNPLNARQEATHYSYTKFYI
jgi:hypothetical protein